MRGGRGLGRLLEARVAIRQRRCRSNQNRPRNSLAQISMTQQEPSSKKPVQILCAADAAFVTLFVVMLVSVLARAGLETQ